MAKSHHKRQLDFFLSRSANRLMLKKSSSHRSWTPAPDLGNQRNMKTVRKPDKTRSSVACVLQIVLS